MVQQGDQFAGGIYLALERGRIDATEYTLQLIGLALAVFYPDLVL